MKKQKKERRVSHCSYFIDFPLSCCRLSSIFCFRLVLLSQLTRFSEQTKTIKIIPNRRWGNGLSRGKKKNILQGHLIEKSFSIYELSLLFVRLVLLFERNPICLGKVISVREHHQTSTNASETISLSFLNRKAKDFAFTNVSRNRTSKETIRDELKNKSLRKMIENKDRLRFDTVNS